MNKKRMIFHIDVNSAYLSWEAVHRLRQGDALDLRRIPSVVGGDPKKRSGVVLAKSYATKPFKIKTGETLYSAFKKCSSLTVVPPNYDLYMDSSNKMIELISEYTDEIEQYSIDEVFVDVTNAYTKHTCYKRLANEIRYRIYKELGFTVCVGMSNNKLLAKMATDLRKPNYTNTLFPEEIDRKLWPLPVKNLFMVGKKTEEKLHSMGIYTIGDIAETDRQLLRYILKSHGDLIHDYSNGIDSSKVNNEKENAKGLGNSTTLPYDIYSLSEAKMIVLGICENLGRRLRANKYKINVIEVHIKSKELKTKRKQMKISCHTDTTNTIYHHACHLLEQIWIKNGVRQIGVSTSGVSIIPFEQQSMFSSNKTNSTIDKVIDDLRLRFGNDSIQRASFIKSNHKHMIGGTGDDDNYPMPTSLL